MQLTSYVFSNQGLIPKKYACDGENINPPFFIQDAPYGTKSFVLIMEDPDVPLSIRSDGMWDHWVVFDIPAEITHVDEGSASIGIEGRNTNNQIGYSGPCPPDREHRYFFKLYALDCLLNLKEKSSKKKIQQAMENHILAKSELIGRYERIGR